jgi:hypothetical protein
MLRFLVVSSCVLLISACGNETSEIIEQTEAKVAHQLPEEIDFNFHVKPILSDTCYLCHGPDIENNKAGLNLSDYTAAVNHVTDSGMAALNPGAPELSEMIKRLHSQDENTVMPPPSSNLVLSDYDKAILAKWIEQGAEYKKHWAFIKPETPEVPEIDTSENSTENDTIAKTWASNEIDSFVLQQQQMLGFSPQEKADKESLIRRVTFDLTGLPPTIDEIDQFLQDNSEQAYQKLVERLLDTQAYGERMATEWLDVARYADTHGYSTDFYRDMSPYRDWVIKAFNNNQPMDEFITWQIAGDLMPEPELEQLIATAFNRVHAQNGEGGIVNEEFRVEYVKDRVQTIGTGLMGLTMHCAQCHDHKYDPISAADYYSTTAFFNNIKESGQISYDPNDMPVPTLMLPTETQATKLDEISQDIVALNEALVKNQHSQNAAFTRWYEKNKGKSVSVADSDIVAFFPLDEKDSNQKINNIAGTKAPGVVIFGSDPKKKEGAAMVHVQDGERSAVKINGDDPLYFPDINYFDRATPFTVAIDANIDQQSKDGVLLHYNKAGILYNFKGFDISVEDGRWQVRLAHTYPYNAIVLQSTDPVKRSQWQQVAMTYDGSSTAAGVHFYINGQAVDMNIVNDNLYKDLKHTDKNVLKEIGIKVGARWRSRGLPDSMVDNIAVYKRDLSPLEVSSLHSETIIEDKESALALFNRAYNEDYKNTFNQLVDLRREHNQVAESVQEIMVMDEAEQTRQAFVLVRGGYANHGEPVGPGVPERILPFNDEWPKNRLGLAKWLTSPEHPLVPRVLVNRYWQMLFGRGLVATPEDFGNQGDLPSHPALLDFLARKFVDEGWDVKDFIKTLVMTNAYQQSSKATSELVERDPKNVWLARGPSSRLTAEMIRDNALASSGLLVRKIGGKSVRPYQPDGIWKMNNKDYIQGEGEELYRRSMYTIYKRSAPPPNMMAFDAPSRDHSVGVRQQTSTPLQALALLNDPQIIEASRVLAQNVINDADDIEQQISLVYRKLTSRFPSDAEIDIIKNMYMQVHASFKERPSEAESFLTLGETEVDSKLDHIQLAALSSVTNILINHDASVIKR